MLKLKEFQNAKMLLFDGESGLRGKRVQNILKEKYDLKIHAEPYFKRSMAERAIKEVKLRMALLLEMEGMIKNGNVHLKNISLYMFFVFLGQPLTKWRDYLDRVVDSINHHNERTFKSMNQLLVSYFTQPTHHMLQTPNKYYKYNINDKVFLEATPSQRKSLSFKYSLNRGMFFYKNLKKGFFFIVLLLQESYKIN